MYKVLMGINKYNSWIREQFPTAVLNQYSKTVYDNIYVDCNHLFYIAEYKSTNIKTFLNQLYGLLDLIFNTYIATKKIVLSVDGASPYSKVLLQQLRRKECTVSSK